MDKISIKEFLASPREVKMEVLKKGLFKVQDLEGLTPEELQDWFKDAGVGSWDGMLEETERVMKEILKRPEEVLGMEEEEVQKLLEDSEETISVLYQCW